MKIHLLDDDLHFPPVEEAGEHGLLAVGGDLSAARLLAAYEHGAFPWFMPDDPILWWAPFERAVLPAQGLKVSKSMRNELNRNRYRVTLDRAFEDVVRGCQTAPRDGEGTWISDDIVSAYLALHELGVAHSIEAWDGDTLAGGLYGVSLGRMFFGESMFSKATNASKVAFVKLVRWLELRGFGPVDCQIMNPHLASMGVQPWPREAFQTALNKHLHSGATLQGPWTSFEDELARHE
jgi:leucyl/phenylalanyl-tRNA---protein transferase